MGVTEMNANAKVASACLAFGGVMMTLPYWIRADVNERLLTNNESGAKVRGQFQNSGSRDVGPSKTKHDSVYHSPELSWWWSNAQREINSGSAHLQRWPVTCTMYPSLVTDWLVIGESGWTNGDRFKNFLARDYSLEIRTASAFRDTLKFGVSCVYGKD